MRIEIRHFGKIENGRKVYYNPELYSQQIAELNGKEFVETIKERHRPPSTNQHNYYRGAILPTCHKSEHFIYYDKTEDIHEDYFAEKFLTYKKEIKMDNERYLITKKKSTSELNQAEMAIFIERVIVHCAELGIDILSPDEYINKHYNL